MFKFTPTTHRYSMMLELPVEAEYEIDPEDGHILIIRVDAVAAVNSYYDEKGKFHREYREFRADISKQINAQINAAQRLELTREIRRSLDEEIAEINAERRLESALGA